MNNQVLSIQRMNYLKSIGMDISDASMAYYCKNKYICKPGYSYSLPVFKDELTELSENDVYAYTVSDIIRKLPASITVGDAEFNFCLYKYKNMYVSAYRHLVDYEDDVIKNYVSFSMETEIDALYSMLIYCIENNYISLS